MSDRFRQIQIRIQRIIKGFSMRKIADEAADRIRVRTRLGFGVKNGVRGGKRVKLKRLTSEQYKKFRKRFRGLSGQTTPKRSNLTLTGELLDSIISRFRGNKAMLEFKNPERNNTIVEGQADMGRHFFELTDKEVKGLQNQIKRDLIKQLRKK